MSPGCKVYLSVAYTWDLVILLGSYVCYTTNMLDTIEAFISETSVQLATTEPMCYSTGCSALTGVCIWSHPALHCAVPYIASCVDVSRMVLLGRSRRTFKKRSKMISPVASKEILGSESFTRWLVWSASTWELGKIGKFLHPHYTRVHKVQFFYHLVVFECPYRLWLSTSPKLHSFSSKMTIHRSQNFGAKTKSNH